MSNELKDICERLEGKEYVDKTKWLVTRAEKISGGWEIQITKQEELQEAGNGGV